MAKKSRGCLGSIPGIRVWVVSQGKADVSFSLGASTNRMSESELGPAQYKKSKEERVTSTNNFVTSGNQLRGHC